MRIAPCLARVDSVIATARADMANFQIHKALAAIIDVVADGDRYFDSQEPWALKKTDPARMETVLYITAETVRQISILLQPFMPESAAKLLDLLGIPTDKRDFMRLEKPAVWKRERRSTSRRRSFRAMSRRRGGVRRMLVDTHCHLDFADFDAERDELVERAHASGVRQMVTISTRVREAGEAAGAYRALSQRLLFSGNPSQQCR
jgi:valyl-tRNA synthetase